MAEAGFAAPSGTETEQEQPQNQTTEAPPIDPATATLDAIEEQINEGIGALNHTAQNLLPAGTRKKIIRAEVDKLLIEKFGEGAVKMAQANEWMYERLHENYSAELSQSINEGVLAAFDEIVTKYMTAAANHINRNNHEDVYTSTKKFTAWVDCFIREVLPVSASTMSAPSSIAFELLNGVDVPEPSGIKVAFIWRGDGLTGRMSGIVRGNNMVLSGFPWVGRAMLVIPDDADDATKELVKGRRRLYAKALLTYLLNSVSC